MVALGSRLKAAVEAFQQRQAALAGANACACTACAGISRLDLKILLHRGDVVRFRAATGEELSGLPVIVLHRLAKNGVRRARYLLWTDALAELVTPLPGAVARRVERYDDIGAVPVSVVTDLPGPLPPKPTGLVLRWRTPFARCCYGCRCGCAGCRSPAADDHSGAVILGGVGRTSPSRPISNPGLISPRPGGASPPQRSGGSCMSATGPR